MVPVVGVAVEPRHEFGGGVASCEILAGDPHPPICLCAGGEADLVKVLAEVGQADVLSHLHIAVEPERLFLGDAVEHPRDILDLLVIRGDTKTHEAERSRETIEHVDLDMNVGLLEKGIGGIEPSRPRPDDSHPERVVRCPQFRRHERSWQVG